MRARALMNADLIRRRRIELRMSGRDLAKQLGVSTASVTNLEAGHAHGEQPLSLLFRLADVLAVDVFDLLATDRVTAQASSEGEANLVAKVGGALFELSHLTSPQVLADAFSVTTSDVEEAARLLGPLAEATGLRVHRQNGDISLVRSNTALTVEELRAAWQRDFASRSLNLTQALTLYRVWRGGFEQKQLSNPERVTLAQLVNAGLVEVPVEAGANAVVLSADARDSLAPPTADAHADKGVL